MLMCSSKEQQWGGLVPMLAAGQPKQALAVPGRVQAASGQEGWAAADNWRWFMTKQPMAQQCRGRTPVATQPLAVHPAALHGCVLQSMVRQCMSYIPDTPDKVAPPAAVACCAVRCHDMLRCAVVAAKAAAASPGLCVSPPRPGGSTLMLLSILMLSTSGRCSDWQETRVELIKTLQALTEGKVGPGLRLCLRPTVCSPFAHLCDCLARCLALTPPLASEADVPECCVAAAHRVAVTWGCAGRHLLCWCNIWPCQAAAHVKLVLLLRPSSADLRGD